MSLTNSFWSAVGFSVVLTAVSNTGIAQEPPRPIRVGLFVSGFASEYAGHDRGLIAGLRDRGYIEGKNLTAERRYGNLEMQRISGFAQELAKSELDAIVTVCTVTTRAAVRATNRNRCCLLQPDLESIFLAETLKILFATWGNSGIVPHEGTGYQLSRNASGHADVALQRWRAAMVHYIGLDVSLKQTSICVVNQVGSTVRECVVDSEPEAIAAFVRSRAPEAVRIGLETGPTATWRLQH
jgi:hypothetical protein